VTWPAKLTFNPDNKFDLQLDQSVVAERRLAAIFAATKLEKIELKTETWQWEQTGNMCIEYRQNGQPSGIAVTLADLLGARIAPRPQNSCYLMFPTDRLKEFARQAYAEGRYREAGGDGGRFSNVLVPLSWVLR
jgi:hypothetical protein